MNLKGVFIGLQAAAPVMIEQGFGNIINMASIGALPGVLGGFAYDTTKAGVVKMTILAQASFVTDQSIVVDGGLVVCGWGSRQAQLFGGEPVTAR